MSTVIPSSRDTTVTSLGYVERRENAASRKQTDELEVDGLQADLSASHDTAEISAEARALSEAYRAGRSEMERDEFSASVRTHLEALMKSRRDVDSHIETVLKNAGIKLPTGTNMRLETTGGGRIRVGGIEDKELRKRVEDALNRESGLGKKVRDHTTLEQKVSQQLKSDTGKTLKELIETQKGELKTSDEQKLMDKVSGLEFTEGLEQFQLFNENGDLETMIAELGESGAISYSASSMLTEPEGTIKGLMSKSHSYLTHEFLHINRQIVAEKSKDPEVTIDDEFKRQYLLDLSAVSISVGSNGDIQIEGQLCLDPDYDKDGKELIIAEMEKMMEETNGDGLILFEEATARIVDDYQLAYGDEAADDPIVRAEVGQGHVGTEVRLSSPAKEAELDEDINVQANELMADMVDFEIEEPFEFSLNKDGTLSITNLPENDIQRQQVLEALEVMNANIANGNEDDEKFGQLTRTVNHRRVFMAGGIAEMYNREEKSSEVTMASYSVHGGEEVTHPDAVAPVYE